MEKPVTLLDKNYITRLRTRRKGSGHLWAWLCSILAVCSVLSFYEAPNANAQEMSCDTLLQQIDIPLSYYQSNMKNAQKAANSQQEAFAQELSKNAQKSRNNAAEWAMIYQAKCK